MAQIIPDTESAKVAAMAAAIQFVDAGPGEQQLEQFLKIFKAIMMAANADHAGNMDSFRRLNIKQIMEDFKS